MTVGRFGRLAALVLFGLAPAAAHAADVKAYETTHFIIYTKSGDAGAERLATRLETIDGLMRMASAISDKIAPIKVRIYEVDTEGEVEAALGLSNTGIAGFYTSNIIGPFAVTPHSTTFHNGDFTPELVLHHEYAHHFMLQYFPAVYPQWYVEGFAELIGSSTIQSDGKVAYGTPPKSRGHEFAADWVPLQDVFLKPPEKLYGLDPYRQGWTMTHFFTFSNERSAQLRAYLNALNAGKSPAEAAKAFGDLTKLDREARAYLISGSFVYKLVAVPIARPVIQAVHPVSAGEAALIPETIAFSDDDLTAYRKAAERDHEQHRRDDILRSIRNKARLYPNDPFALYLLAQTEYSSGHYAESEAAADRLLAVDPNHVRGLVIKSMNLARAAGGLSGSAQLAKAQEARTLALKANRSDPNDPLPLLAFYQSYHLAGLKPIPAAVENLLDVSLTLPDNTQIRQLLVDEYAAEHKWAFAIAALAPIANNPHDSPLRTAAREKMAQLAAELQKAQAATAQPQPSAVPVAAAAKP
jgi:tetratricopeptide (TPR) repeat protein